MSNFTCNQCHIDNFDSESGYYRGCAHYQPERDGEYIATVLIRNDPHVADGKYDLARYYKAGGWELAEFEKVLSWIGRSVQHE